jgi:protein-S-isoprenylcysteine O-methyltransferase Ste14
MTDLSPIVRAIKATETALALLVWRTIVEDRMLQRDLPGYADYAARVPYRLVPGLW